MLRKGGRQTRETKKKKKKRGDCLEKVICWWVNKKDKNYNLAIRDIFDINREV